MLRGERGFQPSETSAEIFSSLVERKRESGDFFVAIMVSSKLKRDDLKYVSETQIWSLVLMAYSGVFAWFRSLLVPSLSTFWDA